MLKILKSCLVVILLLSNILTLKAQDTARNSIEINPFYGLQMFSSEKHKLKGTLFGIEAGYTSYGTSKNSFTGQAIYLYRTDNTMRSNTNMLGIPIAVSR